MRGPVPISKPAQQKNKCKRAVPKKSGTVPSANLDLETLDFAFYIGSTPTFLYFNLYLNTAYAAYYIYIHKKEGFNSILSCDKKRLNLQLSFSPSYIK